jgi:ParB-like chromosome segregation protein Spo0J
MFVTLRTEDRALRDLQKRIDKLSLIQLWVMKASALFERYIRNLDLLDAESDSVKRGLLVEEIKMSAIS